VARIISTCPIYADAPAAARTQSSARDRLLLALLEKFKKFEPNSGRGDILCTGLARLRDPAGEKPAREAVSNEKGAVVTE